VYFVRARVQLDVHQRSEFVEFFEELRKVKFVHVLHGGMKTYEEAFVRDGDLRRRLWLGG
jgi:hypothetical protein